MPTPAPTGGCGDGALQMGEQCDDGNRVDGDTCPADCRYDGSLIRGERANPGASRHGCQVEWYVVNPGNAPDHFGLPSQNQVCEDGDPSCDHDSMKKRCRFQVVVCINNDDPNLPACAAAGVSSVTVLPPRPRLFRSARVQALADANVAKVRDAIMHLLDPSDPDAGYSHAPPLAMAQRGFCSRPTELDVLAVSPRPHESALVGQTIKVRSADDAAPRLGRELSRLRLTCRARRFQ